MIMNFLKKVPAGMMIVPLLIGAILNTFCSSILQVGSLTTATFSNAGAATAMGIQLVCLGTTLRFNELGSVLKRGGVLLISKFVAGAVIGIVVGKVFGTDGFLGLSALAIICAVTNSNGSVYLSLMQSYGDEVIWRDRNGDVQKIKAITDVPMYHKVAIKEMPKGTEVVKYGEHIGLAACDIHVGEHVHVHNVQNHRENL